MTDIRVIKCSVLKCSTSIESIIKKVTAEFNLLFCEFCDDRLKLVTEPVFLSDFLLIETTELESNVFTHNGLWVIQL